MCGFFGVVGSENSACHEIYEALISLQHRGQDAAGIVTHDDRFHLKKGNGLVRDVFRLKNMERLTGSSGIGQVRYPTFGGSTTEDAQPFVVNYPYGIAMAHNGNVTNGEEVKNWLSSQKRTILHSSCDVELILFTLAVELSEIGDLQPDSESVFAALKKVLERVHGAFSVATLISQFGMVAFRDPNGIRPMVMGSKENSDGTLSWACSSENIPLEILGYKNVEMIKAGETVIFIPGKDPIRKQLVQRAHNPCIFEHVYFARPDSRFFGESLYSYRQRIGQILARESAVEADLVIGVPDSGIPAAIGYSQSSGIPYADGLIKNRYVGRTFIQPTQAMREAGIRVKLNPLPDVLNGKRVVVIDDSIVRGTTSKKLVQALRDAGAIEVHMRISSPPVTHPCFYGIDTDTQDQLIAARLTLKEIEEHLKVDSLAYLSKEGMVEAAHAQSEHFCTACFDGNYPVPMDASIKASKLMLEPAGVAATNL